MYQIGFAIGGGVSIGDNPFTGRLVNGSGISFGSIHVAFSPPNAKAIYNGGSMPAPAGDRQTLTVAQDINEEHWGNDINFGSNGSGLVTTSPERRPSRPARWRSAPVPASPQRQGPPGGRIRCWRLGRNRAHRSHAGGAGLLGIGAAALIVVLLRRGRRAKHAA